MKFLTKLCTIGVSLGEAQDPSPRRQPWNKADGWISPGGATDKAEQLISRPDSFAPAGAWLLDDAKPTAGAVGYNLTPLRGYPMTPTMVLNPSEQLPIYLPTAPCAPT